MGRRFLSQEFRGLTWDDPNVRIMKSMTEVGYRLSEARELNLVGGGEAFSFDLIYLQ